MNIYFPETIFEESSVPHFDLLTKVEPTYTLPDSRKAQLSTYYQSIHSIIKEMVPHIAVELLKEHQFNLERCKKLFYKEVIERSPLIKPFFYNDDGRITISIATLCKAKYTQEVGRFICDYFSKWLMPGKSLTLSHVHSAEIRFCEFRKSTFFFHEMFIHIDSEEQLKHIQGNLPDLIRELKLNILTVYHARRVLSTKSLTEEQKKIIIQENISELLDIPSKGYNHNLFEQMQHFLIKASSEEKIKQIRNELSPLLRLKPQIFERDLFNEIQRFILPTRKEFLLERKLSHVKRVLAYAYLLRKRAAYAFDTNPAARFAVTKVLRTSIKQKDEERKVVGILVGLNYSSESEIFDERHLLAAIHSIIPEAAPVENSSIHNKREYTGTRIIYLEIEKENDFTCEELNGLQKNLTAKVLSRVESFTNSIFMPRNEEEIMRNILTLSSQLKFPTDIPQVMINYQYQKDNHLVFTVLLARIEHPDLPLIKKCSNPDGSIFINDKEEKLVGLVRKKFRKKAYTLEICCKKTAYLRSDFSLDLTRARKNIFNFICGAFGEVRDFNGGMIAKVNEVLVELKRGLLQSNFSDDYILENFFYSFVPRFMQCLIPAAALKHSFTFLQEALEHDFNKSIYYIKTITWERYFIITVATINQSFKEFIEEKVSNLDFDPSSLAISYTNIHDVPVLSYILNFSDPQQSETLMKTLVEGIKEWKTRIS